MSKEELTKAAESQNVEEVENDNLSDISGGIIFKSSKQIPGYDPDHPWEVLDDKSGKVLQKFSSRENAENYCTREGLSDKRIWGYGTVKEARSNWNDHIKSGGDPNKFKNDAWGRI